MLKVCPNVVVAGSARSTVPEAAEALSKILVATVPAVVMVTVTRFPAEALITVTEPAAGATTALLLL